MTISLDRLIPIGTSHWPTDETVRLMRELSRLPYKKRKIVLLNIERIITQDCGVAIVKHDYPMMMNADRIRRGFAAAGMDMPS